MADKFQSTLEVSKYIVGLLTLLPESASSPCEWDIGVLRATVPYPRLICREWKWITLVHAH